MPNQRAAGQKLINVPMSEKFIELLDGSVRRSGYSDRSKFIRDAIAEKLQRDGLDVPSVDEVLAPSRLGKGGPRPAPPQSISPAALQLNDAPSSGPLPQRQDEVRYTLPRRPRGPRQSGNKSK
jgi:Arc/MetJ-type ribon-helix-helix transcriptional regulator